MCDETGMTSGTCGRVLFRNAITRLSLERFSSTGKVGQLWPEVSWLVVLLSPRETLTCCLSPDLTLCLVAGNLPAGWLRG